MDEDVITTYPVITETCYLLSTRVNLETTHRFLESLAEGFYQVFHLNTQNITRMVTLMRNYADLPMDFADASLVVLAEHLNSGRIITSDRRDFSIYRWGQNNPFDNLL